MLTIQVCDIPKWLQKGEFYRNLSQDDAQASISVPHDCFLRDQTAAVHVQDVCLQLRVMMFWALDEIPVSVLNYCMNNDVESWRKPISRVPGVVESYVAEDLLTVYSIQGYIPFLDAIRTNRWEIAVHVTGLYGKNGRATAHASHEGNLRLLKYLHENGFVWHEDTCNEASSQGYLDCLQYAHENGCEWSPRLYLGAAAGGHLNCMQYAHAQGLKWEHDTCEYAATNGQLACLQFAHEHGCLWDEYTVFWAACNDFSCLQYALEHGCPIHKEACEQACRSNSVERLMLLHRHNAPWDEITIAFAAKNVDTACLKYLHENQCPWTDRTPHYAVMGHCVDSLRYALEHDCPFDPSLLQFAVQTRAFECVQYLVEVRAMPMSEELFIYALLAGDLTCLRYILERGCPYTSTFPASFVDMEDDDELLNSDNAEFVSCVEYMLSLEWVMDDCFVEFWMRRDRFNCHEFLARFSE